MMTNLHFLILFLCYIPFLESQKPRYINDRLTFAANAEKYRAHYRRTQGISRNIIELSKKEQKVIPTEVKASEATINYEELPPALSIFVLLVTTVVMPLVLRFLVKRFIYWKEPVLNKEKVVPVFPHVTLYAMQQSRRECYLPRQQRTTWAYFSRSYLLSPEDFHVIHFNDIFLKDWNNFKRPRNVWAALQQVLRMNRILKRVKTVRRELGITNKTVTIREKVGDPKLELYKYQDYHEYQHKDDFLAPEKFGKHPPRDHKITKLLERRASDQVKETLSVGKSNKALKFDIKTAETESKGATKTKPENALAPPPTGSGGPGQLSKWKFGQKIPPSESTIASTSESSDAV